MKSERLLFVFCSNYLICLRSSLCVCMRLFVIVYGQPTFSRPSGIKCRHFVEMLGDIIKLNPIMLVMILD